MMALSPEMRFIWYLWSLPSLALIVTQADQQIDQSVI